LKNPDCLLAFGHDLPDRLRISILLSPIESQEREGGDVLDPGEGVAVIFPRIAGQRFASKDGTGRVPFRLLLEEKDDPFLHGRPLGGRDGLQPKPWCDENGDQKGSQDEEDPSPRGSTLRH